MQLLYVVCFQNFVAWNRGEDMKTVKFKRLFDGRTYGVLTTDIETEWDKDHSGIYVLTTEAEAEIKLVSDSYEANKQRWEAEIAALRERQRVMTAALVEISNWSEKLNTEALADIKLAMFQWRGCVSIANQALAQVKKEMK